MNKILDVLLFPLIKLVGWLIMRDLRQRAKGLLEIDKKGAGIRTPDPLVIYR